jgi:hypothetical protein
MPLSRISISRVTESFRSLWGSRIRIGVFNATWKIGVVHKGREYLLNTTLPELFKSFSGEYTYLFERVSNSLIASKSKSTSSAYLLPKSIVRYSVCEITAFDVLPPVFWDSKYWEVRVKAVLQSSDARDVSVHFLVKGSDVDMDRICEVELVNVEPVPVR